MPVSTFLIAPITKSLNAAYRPVIIRAVTTATGGGSTPPVVYCDIYFNGVYYKTLSKSQYTKLNTTVSTEWQFDISDACQEYLKTPLGPNGGDEIIYANTAMLSCTCMVRASGIDSNGFIIPEGVAPIQGTGGINPVSGSGGLETNNFYVFNSALQHEDNQDLYQHLVYYKNEVWVNQYAPLTHRPYVYYIAPGNSDYYPVINQFNFDAINKLDIYAQLKGSLDFLHLSVSVVDSVVINPLLYIPSGPANLATIFPTLDFNNIVRYYLVLMKNDTILATSVMFTLIKKCEDSIRIHFVNYLGTIDAMDLEIEAEEHTTKSDRWEAPLTYPLDKTKHGINRLNVTSNEIYTCVSSDYSEEAQSFIAEFIDTPLAWVEWPGIQGQEKSYLPIVIIDTTAVLKKQEDRYTYEVKMQFTFSHDKITLRN